MVLSYDNIDKVDLGELSLLIREQQYAGYFTNPPGQDHYKTLAYFSTLFNDSVMLDVGTYKGCSALALSYNPSNKVYSFDVHDYKAISSHPSNITFLIDDVLKKEYEEIVQAAPFICLDTDHDGSFEIAFYNYLRTIKWKGLLFLDDIKLNDPMKSFWSQITETKHDITYVGHWSGTGLVEFS